MSGDLLDLLADYARELGSRATGCYVRASELEERATAFYRGDLPAPDGMTSAEAGRPSQVAARDNRSRGGALAGVAADLLDLVARERWGWFSGSRDTDHGAGLSDHAGTVSTDGRTRMDTQTLAGRLEGMAALFRSGDGTFAVSWFYVDPTPDGPEEARTIHTVELDGQNAAEVLNNLDGLISRMTRLEHVAAEATPGRVVLEALGSTQEAGDVRGTAVILEPYATPLQAALDLTPTDPLTPRTRTDLTLALVEQLAADPNMAPGVSDPQPPEVTPSEQTPSGTTGEPEPPQGSPATPSVPDAPQPQPDSPAPPESSTPSASTPSDPATSETGGGTTPAPGSGDAVPDQTTPGGVVVRGNSDGQQPSGPGSPSPDPTSTTTTGTTEPAPVATGQQEGTPDGAPTNADGTPVEPTAGTTADVGPAPTSEQGPTADPTLPGQRPVDVSDTPLTPGGAGSTGSAEPTATADQVTADQGNLTVSGNSDRASRLAELRAEVARLEAEDNQQQSGDVVAQVTSDDGEVQVATHVDPEPAGGQNLASGQGGGATGDPAGGGYGTSAGGGAGSYNSDGM